VENLPNSEFEDDVEGDNHGAVGNRRRTPYLARQLFVLGTDGALRSVST
jgi:hypothetical protein